jgi:hypothetical protein
MKRRSSRFSRPSSAIPLLILGRDPRPLPRIDLRLIHPVARVSVLMPSRWPTRAIDPRARSLSPHATRRPRFTARSRSSAGCGFLDTMSPAAQEQAATRSPNSASTAASRPSTPASCPVLCRAKARDHAHRCYLTAGYLEDWCAAETGPAGRRAAVGPPRQRWESHPGAALGLSR